jgi:hypothetical protein
MNFTVLRAARKGVAWGELPLQPVSRKSLRDMRLMTNVRVFLRCIVQRDLGF